MDPAAALCKVLCQKLLPTIPRMVLLGCVRRGWGLYTSCRSTILQHLPNLPEPHKAGSKTLNQGAGRRPCWSLGVGSGAGGVSEKQWLYEQASCCDVNMVTFRKKRAMQTLKDQWLPGAGGEEIWTGSTRQYNPLYDTTRLLPVFPNPENMQEQDNALCKLWASG